MFWATMCPSSGEITVSMRHLVPATMYGWLCGMEGDKYRVSHRYSYFSWWWAHIRPKYVEKRNKYTKKNCAPRWLYLQDNRSIYAWVSKIVPSLQFFWLKFYFYFSFPLYEKRSKIKTNKEKQSCAQREEFRITGGNNIRKRTEKKTAMRKCTAEILS